jgi:hypothetical protein
VEYGTPIQRAAHDAQESVKKSIESMTGLHVVRVDIHVLGVSFEKEKNALEAGAGKAVLESGVNAAPEGKAEETVSAAEEAPAEEENRPESPVRDEEPAEGKEPDPA